MIQASWLCSGTWLCTNTVATSGSRPTANSIAASSTVRWPTTPGSSVTVRAWRSTMPWKASCSCWSGDPVPQRPEVVAEVDVAGGLDARQHTGHDPARYRSECLLPSECLRAGLPAPDTRMARTLGGSAGRRRQ